MIFLHLNFRYETLECYKKLRAWLFSLLNEVFTHNPDHFGIHILFAIGYSDSEMEVESRSHIGDALRTYPQLSLMRKTLSGGGYPKGRR